MLTLRLTIYGVRHSSTETDGNVHEGGSIYYGFDAKGSYFTGSYLPIIFAWRRGASELDVFSDTTSDSTPLPPTDLNTTGSTNGTGWVVDNGPSPGPASCN